MSRGGGKKITVCGYYGRGNLGDEMILEAIARVTPKIRTLRGKNMLHLLSDMLGADVFVFGGGSLLQNATSNASLFYYLALIFASRPLCRRRVMLANGMGPINDSFFSQDFLKKMIKDAVDSFDIISVRDGCSQKYLQELLPVREILLVPDPALLLIEPKINQRLRKTGRFLYIPCASGLKRARIDERSVVKALREAERELGLAAFFAVMNENEDAELARRLSKALGGRRICAPKSASELRKALSEAEITICQRFHGALFSSALGVPTLCVSDDPKMMALCEDFGLYRAISPVVLSDSSALLYEMDGAKRHFGDNCESIYEKFQAAKVSAESSLKSIIG